MTVKRIKLENEQWWEIDTDPPWGVLKQAKGQTDDSGLLALLTPAWSFPEAITPEAVDGRRLSEISPVLQEVSDTILPLLAPLVKRANLPSTAPSGAVKS